MEEWVIAASCLVLTEGFREGRGRQILEFLNGIMIIFQQTALHGGSALDVQAAAFRSTHILVKSPRRGTIT